MNLSLVAATLSVGSATSTDSNKYCPSETDMFVEYDSTAVGGQGGNVAFLENGWSITGAGRVSTKTAWNLLGGSIEFEMDTSKTNAAVNTNVYTTSPKVENCGMDCYCDIQDGSQPAYFHRKPYASCMEMDIIEANGHCAMATTWHTTTGGGGCDRGGCQAESRLPSSGVVSVKVSFSADGWMTVTLDGARVDKYGNQPSQSDAAIVSKTMTTVGAIVESSQWVGWVPGGDCPTGGDLATSHYEVRNLRVTGDVVQGPVPSLCGSRAATPSLAFLA